MLKEQTMTKKTPWKPPKGIKEAQLEIENDNFELLITYLETEVYPTLISQHEAISGIYTELDVLRNGPVNAKPLPLKVEIDHGGQPKPPINDGLNEVLDRLDIIENNISKITEVLDGLVKFLEKS